MSRVFSAEQLRLDEATWAAELARPTYGDIPQPANLGSWWQTYGDFNFWDLSVGLWAKQGTDDLIGWKNQNQSIWNVKRFGAMGDGVTDDSAAIENAIRQADAVGGGVVYFPPGTYAVVPHLSIGGSPTGGIYIDGKSKVTLMGDGAASVLKTVYAAVGGQCTTILIVDSSDISLSLIHI